MAKGVKANKLVIVLAVATIGLCLLSLSLKSTVVSNSYQATVSRLSDLKRGGEVHGGSIDGATLLEEGKVDTEFEKALKEKGSDSKILSKGKGEKENAGETAGKGAKKSAGDKKAASGASKPKEKKGSDDAVKKAAQKAQIKAQIAAQNAKKDEEVKKNKASVLEKLSKVKAAPKSTSKGDATPKLRTAKGKPINVLAAYGTEQERVDFKCGKMPESMWPKFTLQKIKKGGSRRYIAKNGYVSPMNVHKKLTRAKTENGPRRGRIEKATGRLKKGEQPLIKCLNHLGQCNNASLSAARGLDGMMTLLSTRNAMLKKTYKTCALVGNSGAMKEKKYGQYIDRHDFVARVNALPTRKFEDNLGHNTSLRVMSFKISKDVCCFRKNYKPDNKNLQFPIWFPASRSDILKQLRRKYPTNPSSVMPTPFLSTAVNVFKQLRKDLLRLGYGPFEEWEYMTSGMHALLGLVQSCKVVNLYGFTKDVSTKGPYWFTGRRQPPRSGRTQHAWDHERMVLRSLYAAGLINICTP